MSTHDTHISNIPLLLRNTHTWLAGSEIKEEYAQGVQLNDKNVQLLNCFLKGQQ